MSDASQPGTPSISFDSEIELICVRFEEAWKAGQRPSVEQHLDEMLADGRRPLLLELLKLDVYYRRRIGEETTPEEYAARFPGYSELLRGVFTEAYVGEQGAIDDAAVTPPNDGRDTLSLGETPDFRSSKDEDFPRPFGRYELRTLLGRGGMGTVYLAHDPQLDRLVALKIPRVIEGNSLVWRERFLAEARAAATLQHPNICPVFEVGKADSQPYLTMAYIEGESLATRLQRTGPPPISEALALVRTISRAMAEAHDRGIVHRDLKPANVMIDRRGQPVVMDFGLALRATATDDLRLTLSGVAMGTPAYMPPEQAGGDHDAIGPPADVYALGIILYELVTGRVPFQGKSFGKLLAQIERDLPPSPSTLNATIDPALETIILRALAKDPGDRFATAGALADALDAHAQGERDFLAAKHGRADSQATELTDPYIPADESTPLAILAAKTATRRPRWIAIGTGLVGVSLLAVLAWANYGRTRSGDGGIAQQPDNPPAEKKPVHLKPVEFPKQATLVEIPGYQVLADAKKEEMQHWLDDRKKNEHSVTRLDAVQVGDKPVFAAVAALDGRQKNWLALLDLTETEINDGNSLIANRLNGVQHEAKSLSGYVSDNELRVTALFSPGNTQAVVGVVPMTRVQPALAQTGQQGFVVQLIRPLPVGDSQLRCALNTEAHIGKKSAYGLNLNESELAIQLEEHRSAAYRPMSVVAYPDQGELRFAVTYQEDATKSAWEVHRGLTSAELKAEAAGMAAKGFTPASVTVCPWDGAVRYAVVWVKEPPKPVEFPKRATLVEIPGYQVLADATKEELQQWLDERKKSMHSVVWLDAVQVGEKPVFASVAALDGRAKNWLAFLDLSEDEMNHTAVLSKRLDLNDYLITSLSGYCQGNKNVSVALFRPGQAISNMGIVAMETVIPNLARAAANGYRARLIRPFPVCDDTLKCGLTAEAVLSERALHGFELTEAELTAQLDEYRKDGYRPMSVVAYPNHGEMRFAVTYQKDATKPPWEVDRNLTAAEMKTKAAEVAAKGMAPASITACPWSGAVRYAVVWVKQPPPKK